MNKLAKRAWFALVLTLVLLGGMVVIVVRYITDASQWVGFRSNPGVQVSGSLSSYSVCARDGTSLLNTEGSLSYAEEAALRASLLHLLGDGGNVSSYVTDQYGDALTGFDHFNGIHSSSDAQGELKLTISPLVQKTAYYAMQGKKGVVGVYNYQTGEVLCMLSMPTYDPENPPETIYTTDENGNSVVMDEYDSVYFNRFVWSTYIPGSTFKLVTAAAALERMPDIEERVFTCEGSINIGGRQIVCSGGKAHGQIGMEQALSSSCNVTFAQIADELGKELLTEFSDRVRITKPLEFDGLKTTAGSVDLSDADSHAVAWAGIGQAYDQINPCQFMTFVGAVANGGKAAVPYVVEEVTYGGDETYQAKTQMQFYLSLSTSERLAQMMRYAVNNNYIWSCNFAGLRAGGKSGTAERDSGTQDALFAGFIQDADYPLAYIVIVEDGGSGSGTCLPILQQVLNACVSAMDAEA